MGGFVSGAFTAQAPVGLSTGRQLCGSCRLDGDEHRPVDDQR
jgi:hypothetical protein